jgi:phospholipid transport system substrate-binding protein
MRHTVAALLAAAVCAMAPAAHAADGEGPRAVTARVLGQSNAIVHGNGDRPEKLRTLTELLRDFLDTEALARLAAGSNLDHRSPDEVHEFLGLFQAFFVRTYVQRLLLFDAPDFAFGDETVSGDTARVATEVVTPNDRFAVDYVLRRSGSTWRATDIVVEGVSLAHNFRSQFDAAVAKGSFEGLLERLRAKAAAQEAS